jgi:hypothetical protein
LKNRPNWIGALTALLVGSVLAIAAFAPRAVGRAPAEPLVLAHPACDLLLQSSEGAEPFGVGQTAGVNQPIGGGNIAACSLKVDASWSSARLELVQWDPLTLLPDPSTVALRTRSFDPSAIQYSRTRADFFPPVVTRSVPHVAEPPRLTTAIDWRATLSATTLRYNPDGPAEIPAALQYGAGGGARSPLPGAHPVLAHAVCGSDEAVQRLQIIQSVMTTTVHSDSDCFDLIQRFRVPVHARLHWVEVAFDTRPAPGYPTGQPILLAVTEPGIAILDAAGQKEPPVELPWPLVQAPFTGFTGSPGWVSHMGFDNQIVLEPGHDYWLLARVAQRFSLFTRVMTGAEGPDFTENIGPFFKRTTDSAPWQAIRGRSLSFRMIGEPTGTRALPRGRQRGQPLGDRQPGTTDPPARPEPSTTTASGAQREPARLTLGVAPNPSKGASFVSWSGASGSLRLEVLDAQGRRVAGIERAGAEGRWLWSGAREDGSPLPAGVYFMRGTDGAGRVAADRVVLIR